MSVIFSSQPSQLLRSASCSQHSALHSPVFRAGFTSAIFLPVTLIILTYLYFYYILSRRTRYPHSEPCQTPECSNVCSLSTTTTAIQRQNMTAARITLLILFSCLICWVPASLTHLLFCPAGERYRIKAFRCYQQSTSQLNSNQAVPSLRLTSTLTPCSFSTSLSTFFSYPSPSLTLSSSPSDSDWSEGTSSDSYGAETRGQNYGRNGSSLSRDTASFQIELNELL